MMRGHGIENFKCTCSKTKRASCLISIREDGDWFECREWGSIIIVK